MLALTTTALPHRFWEWPRARAPSLYTPIAVYAARVLIGLRLSMHKQTPGALSGSLLPDSAKWFTSVC